MLFEGIESLLGHRSGAFGSGLGGGNFMDTGFGGGRPEEIIENNYYGASGDAGGAQSVGNDPGSQGTADYQGASFDPGSLPSDSDLGFGTPDTDTSDDASSSFTDGGGDSGSSDFSSDDGGGSV